MDKTDNKCVHNNTGMSLFILNRASEGQNDSLCMRVRITVFSIEMVVESNFALSEWSISTKVSSISVQSLFIISSLCAITLKRI